LRKERMESLRENMREVTELEVGEIGMGNES